MATNIQPAVRPPRLNPFAFPSDTNFRFILLIVSVLGASLFIYNAVYFSIPATRDYWLDVQNQCWAIRPDLTNLEQYTDPQMRAAQLAFERCRAPAERSNAAWTVGGVILLLVVAGLIYWTFPLRKIRRQKLAPLTAEDAPEVVEYLAGLCRALKLSPQPVFLWNPLNRASGGLAFGRLGTYYVSLTGGLVTQFYTDLPAFRAVVLHELAHLRNADVDRTYFAVAVWQAFAIVALLPLLVTIFGNEWGYVFNIFWRVLALAVLVYLMRNAVLRTREMYADVRASLWDGSTSALSRVLHSISGAGKASWRRFMQVHPDPGHRRRVLDDPNHLLPMSFWDAFATGIAAAIALPNLITVMTALLTGTGLSGPESLAAVLVVSPLVVGVVGLGAWRTTFAALERGKARGSLILLGLGLGLGILLGAALAFSSAIKIGIPAELTIPELAFNIAWGILLLISMIFFVKWIATGASAWLEVALASHSPRLYYTLGLTIAGGVLALWLGFLFYLRNLGVTAVFLLVSPLAVIWSIVQHPLTLFGLISLWAFPLAAWSSQKRADRLSASRWALLDPTNHEPVMLRRASFRPGIAVTIGSLAGFLYCAMLLLVRLGLRIGLPESVRSTEDFRLLFFLAQIGFAALFQAGVAAIVAAWVQRWGAVHGLFSAFVAGCVMGSGLLALNVLFGGTIDPQFAWGTFSQVVNEGALLALPSVWFVSVFAGWVRRMRGKPRLNSQGNLSARWS